MKSALVLLAVAMLILSTCAPQASPTATVPPPPSETPAPTATPAPTPTRIPTATPTPIPTLPPEQVGRLEGIPDPKITNPELFDLENPNAPIPQFVNAMKREGRDLDIETVKNSLRVNLETPEGFPPFITYRTSDGIVLLMAQNKEGQWQWKQATATEYWRAYGKYLGYGFKPRQLNQYSNYFNNSLFKGGLYAPSGVLENGGPIENAASLLSFADKNDMAFYLHYVMEPGKFPEGVTKENIDHWLDSRLEEIATLVEQYNTSPAPVIIALNEPWHYRTTGWNPDYNPLREKYGDSWLTEYTRRVINILTIQHGLKINEDYLILFNDDTGLTMPGKLVSIHQTLLRIKTQLAAEFNGSIDPNDIQIVLGLQVGEDLVPSSTITGAADRFADTGGILLTEVNPRNNQYEYLEELILAMKHPNVKGLYFWKIVPEPDEDRVDDHWVLLTTSSGKPTLLYYQLLR